jgi:hypothetical protein
MPSPRGGTVARPRPASQTWEDDGLSAQSRCTFRGRSGRRDAAHPASGLQTPGEALTVENAASDDHPQNAVSPGVSCSLCGREHRLAAPPASTQSPAPNAEDFGRSSLSTAGCSVPARTTSSGQASTIVRHGPRRYARGRAEPWGASVLPKTVPRRNAGPSRPAATEPANRHFAGAPSAEDCPRLGLLGTG